MWIFSPPESYDSMEKKNPILTESSKRWSLGCELMSWWTIVSMLTFLLPIMCCCALPTGSLLSAMGRQALRKTVFMIYYAITFSPLSLYGKQPLVALRDFLPHCTSQNQQKTSQFSRLLTLLSASFSWYEKKFNIKCVWWNFHIKRP